MFVSQDPLRLLSTDHIMRTPMPPVEWIVEPVIAAGERVLLYGEFGALKSWVLLHMGLHIAAGRKWLGTFEVPKPRTVLYIDEEMSEYTMRSRIQRLVVGAKLPTDDMPFAALSQEGVRMTEMGGHILLDRLRRSDFKPEVIIMESMRRVLVGDEKEQVDVSAFWRAIQPLRQAGISVIISHHMRKPRMEGPDESRYRASGSTDLIAGSDSAWAVTKLNANTANLEAIRVRLAQEPKPFAVEFAWDGETGPVTASLGLAPAEARQGGLAVMTILDTLEVGPQTSAQLEAACEAKGVSRATCHRALDALKRQGRIACLSRGMWSLVTID
jgi:hypothetical protein